jgi:NAD(P)-dependent dehydrogenase (short-subunit alcohol dehydrogenase family)
MNTPTRRLEGTALILGASSGFGEAAAIALARAGMHIVGVHLDRRGAQAHIEGVTAKIREAGRDAWFYNVNAADDAKRKATLDDVEQRLAAASRPGDVRVLLHSLAFGSLRPAIAREGGDMLTRMQIEMTLDVMASSLVYWTQDLVARGHLHTHGRVYAMTSEGSRSAITSYGAVGAAKAALEAWVRQLALEGARAGFTANAICAGVTRTPALDRIPGSDKLAERALVRNPTGRLTTPEDVAQSLVALAGAETYWLNGNVLHIDGGEGAAG